jgi:hypothetical protein
MVQLRSGVCVPRKVHDELHGHIRPRLPRLKDVPRLKAKDMVAADYYATLNPWLVGACVSHWEHRGELPLRFLGCPYCSVRFYRVT